LLKLLKRFQENSRKRAQTENVKQRQRTFAPTPNSQEK